MEDRALNVAPEQIVDPPAPKEASSGLTLRPYQEATVEAAITPKANTWRRLLVLATGAGKTVIAAEIIRSLIQPGQRALFIAHRDELLTQAKTEIEGFIPGVHVEIEQAENRASRTGALIDGQRRVVVASVQSMQRNRLQSWKQNTFDLVIIDEAHHGAATSYVNIATHFGCLDEAQRTPLIGVTATPMRSDQVGLDVLFQEIAASYGIRDLVEQGYLCNIRALSVRTETDLRRVKMTAGDYNSRQLEDATDTDERNALILAAHRRFASDRPTLVFATGVDHAKHLADLFRASGVTAEAMYGAMGDDARRDALARYATGETQVLTNYALLTEGFNAPQTSCIILGRPSKSALVITQMIGRGTRLHPGKEDLLVIDVRDVTNGKNLVTASSLAGLPATFDLKGRDMFEAKKRHDELEHLDPQLAQQALTPEAVEESIAFVIERIRAREIELFQYQAAAAEREAREAERAERIRELNARNAARPYDSPFMWFSTSNGISVSPTNETTYEIVPSQDATYYVVTIRQQGEAPHTLGNYADINAAKRAADRHLTDSYHNLTLIRKSASWTKGEATPKQLAALLKFGIRIEGQLTKGEAAMRLNAAFARKAYRAAPVAA